jgi:hypothetical protein
MFITDSHFHPNITSGGKEGPYTIEEHALDTNEGKQLS